MVVLGSLVMRKCGSKLIVVSTHQEMQILVMQRIGHRYQL
jgi:hypothetical protein